MGGTVGERRGGVLTTDNLVPLLSGILAGAGMMLGSLAMAQPVPKFDYTPDFEERAWEEQQAQLPAYPKQENLLKIDLGAAANFDFFVDIASIGIGTDGVVRYTLIARSASGAMNVSFEGIRCSTRERKLYGFGHPGGTWSKARNSDWVPITRVQTNVQHVALADDYFCPKRRIVRTAAEAVSALRRGGHPDAR